MATGKLPFQGDTTAAVFNEILNKAPTSPVRLNPDVPDDLERIINKSLEKESDIRCQSAKDLLTDLKRLKRDTSGESVTSAVPAAIPAKRSYLWPVVAGGLAVAVVLLLVLLVPFSATPPEGAIDSIAVLPLENRSGDPDLEYASDGITQGVISRLSQLSSLNKVISSASMMDYKGKSVDAGTVAEEVDVRAVVRGNMASQGDTLRVYVELIDAKNNSTLWGETYTRPRSQLNEVEEYLSKQIADALGIQLTGEEEEQLGKRYTDNSEAHEAYLKGRAEQARHTVDSYQKAVQYFEEAIERDPNYAPAYAALAWSYRTLGRGMVAIPPQEAMPQAEELALKALELDDTLGLAHAVLGAVQRVYHWDWETAEREYKRAMELDASGYEAPYGYAMLMSALGRHEEAIALSKRAEQVDPLELRTRTGVAQQLIWARQYDEAIEQSRTILDINPDFPQAYANLGSAYGGKGLYQESEAAWQRYDILQGYSREHLEPSEAAILGVEGIARFYLERDTQRVQRGEYVRPTNFAAKHATLGEKDQAFEWLEKAYQEREGQLIFLKVDYRWDPLRDDPRSTDLLRRMNLGP